MRKNFFILVISFATASSVPAQKKKVHFQSINQFAMVGGESQVNSAFQTLNGIKFSNWFSGIGVGIDNYHYKALPLFADAKWYFGDDKNGFLYGDIGYNFPLKNKPEKEIYYYDSYHFSGGIYTDLGIGYQVRLYKKSYLLFSLGHSYKQLQIHTEIFAPCGDCNTNRYDYKFSYGRMILKAGVMF
jgi:hypothetical protein